ncbi:MAG: hypothetical protein R3C49_12750 [Planctomycetaceae bacterium]
MDGNIRFPGSEDQRQRRGPLMAHPWHHAQRSASLFGGTAEDYLAIHDWFDESKAHLADFRHRALRHHSEGIFSVRNDLRYDTDQQ